MKHQLNFSDPSQYFDGVEWVRNNILVKTVADIVLQLDVIMAPNVTVTLYIDTQNLYIMGFRGKEKIYVLNDGAEKSRLFKEAVLKKYKDSPIAILSLGVSHRAQDLGTFSRKGKGVVGRTFRLGDLDSTHLLPNYSREGELEYENLKLPLSLLVCMIAEAARIPMMQRAFANMYFGYRVIVDEIIQSYDDAKLIGRMAEKIFPEYYFAFGVEKIVKRAAEMSSLLEKIGSKRPSVPAGKELIADMVGKKIPQWAVSPKDPSRVAEDIRELVIRFHEIYAELKNPGAEELSEFLTTCKNQNAVWAAKQGIVIPPLGPERKR